ncbi:Protein ZBED8 [Trichinella sp. T8]|nr:Protein ZBED8 [Trichinella sp. T8]
MGYVIAGINKIRSILLNDRLFSQLCEQNDEEFNRLLMHTEVRWLSKDACLSRFYELFETILEFFQNKDPSLRDSLKKCKSDIAYMADLFFKFNELNLQLQGSELNLIKMRSLISPFISILAVKPTHCRRCSTTKSIENLRCCTEKDGNQESEGAKVDFTSKVFIHQWAIFLMHV